MSWTFPGRTSETHSGIPRSEIIAWMLPPKSWVFPLYHKSMVLPLDRNCFEVQPVGVDDLAVEDEVGHAVAVGAVERVV